MSDDIGKRQFLKETVVGTAVLAGALQATAAAPMDPNKQVVAALGSVFIPSAPGDPGYKELESHGITEYVMQNLQVDGLDAFNSGAQQLFDGKTFVELDDKQREQYLGLIVEESKMADEAQRKSLQAFYRGARTRILTIYYKNYPVHETKKNAAGEPILQPGDTHQITNPNLLKDKKLVTGWDIAGYKGPLGWDEEEQLRAKAKKIVPYWYEGRSR